MNNGIVSGLGVFVAVAAMIGAIILPIRGSIAGVNERLDREVEVIEQRLIDLDKQLQTEIGAADAISFERDASQQDGFESAIVDLDRTLQAEDALTKAELRTEIAALRERIEALR